MTVDKNNLAPQTLSASIMEILYDYCRVPSFTNSTGETLVANFFRQQLSVLPYFTDHPDFLGSWEIASDALKRRVSWAMIQGGSPTTVVLAHHSDVVVTDNYAELQPLALDPKKLEAEFQKNQRLLDNSARHDLQSGQWLFGRGTADMKGGGAIQLALFKAYAQLPPESLNRMPTLVLLALPDEENLSAGMRSAVSLLAHLKDRYGLAYELMINSEPHHRTTPETGVIYQGSIAKLNLFVYVKGVMTHVGRVLEGVNPNGVMARIVSRTDLSADFVDERAGQISIPPTWVYLRDVKKQYDASFPEGCYGQLNILNFDTRPEQVMDLMIRICREELGAYLDQVDAECRRFGKKTGRYKTEGRQQPQVITYGELKRLSGNDKIRDFTDIGKTLAALYPGEPAVMVAFRPTYYPGVTNPRPERLTRRVQAYASEKWGQAYINRAYFTGISDLSYAMAAGDDQAMDHMMGWGRTYSIPFDEIKKISMNCINIGPWGKDLHLPSERVFIEDLAHRTPMLIDHVIRGYGKAC